MTIAETSPTDDGAEAGVSLYAKAAIVLFFVVLFIPGSFYLGVRLTPMRVYLLLMIVPTFLRLLDDPTIRPTSVDALVLIAIAWRCLGILANHGTSETIFVVSLFLETAAGYMLGRAFIQSAADFRFFIKCFFFVLLALSPLAFLEFATNQRIMKDLAGIVLEQNPPPQPAQGMRFGLTRVILAFEHPTVFGAVCAMVFVNALYVFRTPFNIASMAFVGFLAMLTISSSTIITLSMQIALLVYASIFKKFTKKWIFLIVVAASLSLSFEIFFGMSVLEFVISKIMFNPISGESRSLHFQFAFKEVLRNPFFGVGLDDWATPFWLSQVVDSYWLSLTLRYGLPGLIFQALMLGVHFLKIAYAGNLTESESRLRIGYNITLASALVMLFYTSFFHSTFIFFMMYCGAGAWFYSKKPKINRPERSSRSHNVPRSKPALRHGLPERARSGTAKARPRG